MRSISGCKNCHICTYISQRESKGKTKGFCERTHFGFSEFDGGTKRKIGGVWYVFLRLHPQLAVQLKGMLLKNKSKHLMQLICICQYFCMQTTYRSM